MDNPFISPAVISICPGILGIERGLERAGIIPRVLAYVEIEAFIIANLVAGMESGRLAPAPIWTDAKTFDAHPFRGRIHGIIGGYPCPGESLAGLREGHKYHGFIWPHIRRAIAATRPVFCFFENVDDHLTGTFPIVQRSLRNMGYRVEGGIYTAEEVGAPHERQRLFILALENTYVARFGRNHICHFFGQFERTGEELKYSLRRRMETSGTDKRKPAKDKAFKTGASVWPMGQGIEQFTWEEPRTIKPGVGSSVDGYNFREDFLRAIGNSVVEQTAEIAFINLLLKHLKNL